MGTAGKSVLVDTGKSGLLANGKRAIYNAAGTCAECCALCPFSDDFNYTLDPLDPTVYGHSHLAGDRHFKADGSRCVLPGGSPVAATAYVERREICSLDMCAGAQIKYGPTWDGQIGVIVRQVDPDDHHAGCARFLLLMAGATYIPRLQLRYGGNWVTVDGSFVGFDYHTLLLCVRENVYRAYVDGVLRVNYTDEGNNVQGLHTGMIMQSGSDIEALDDYVSDGIVAFS